MSRPPLMIAAVLVAMAAPASALADMQALIGGAEAARLETYLDSTWPDGRRLALPGLSVTPDGSVRERRNGDLRALSAVLRAHPQARCRISVRTPPGRAEAEARAVVRALVRAGASPGSLAADAAPAATGSPGSVEITVLAKRRPPGARGASPPPSAPQQGGGAEARSPGRGSSS